MASADTFPQQLAELYPQIAARRQSDPVLDEICRDYEELVTTSGLSETNADQNDDALQRDLNATIQALQEEIRVRLESLTY